MPVQVGQAFGPAMVLDICPARIDRPDRVRDLAPDEDRIIRVAGPQRNVRLTLGEVDILVAHHELHAQSGMARIESLEQTGLDDANHHGLGARHPDDADLDAVERDLSLSKRDGGAFEILGIGQHLLAEGGQTVSGGTPRDEIATDYVFQVSADFERFLYCHGLNFTHSAR